MNYPTWSDLNNDAIVPPLGARQAPDIGSRALLVSTEPDIRYLRTTLGNPKAQGFFMGSLMTPETASKEFSVAGPYIGAPYGVMLLESLIAKGAEQIVVLGWCGALTPDLACGDLVIPEYAIVDEGTSCNYTVLDRERPCTRPDQLFSDQLADHLSASGVKASRLPIWTTDAIYRETPQKVTWFRDKGARAVDMECSALFATAAFRRVKITALLVVSDSLAPGSGEWNPGFRKKTFKAARKSACMSLLSFVEKDVEKFCEDENRP